jgi:hypothetical protein
VRERSNALIIRKGVKGVGDCALRYNSMAPNDSSFRSHILRYGCVRVFTWGQGRKEGEEGKEGRSCFEYRLASKVDLKVVGH